MDGLSTCRDKFRSGLLSLDGSDVGSLRAWVMKAGILRSFFATARLTKPVVNRVYMYHLLA
jgi:hypothetical protein